jgi:serine/threonine-protein kinase
VAALNHPNILTVHYIGTDGGRPFVVFELLQGQTLRRLLHRALSLETAIAYVTDIAQGLAAAHAKNIVHRDIKPENLLVTPDGRVKILDFGIARVQEADGGGEMTLTAWGVAMGTAGYMAPEQVRGDEVDARADVFALGAVFYEMLAGRRAFHGPTTSDTMAAVLTEEPPSLAAVNPGVPPGVVRLVHRCLAKARDERFESARDIVYALEAALEGRAVPRTTGWLPWAAAAVAVVASGSLAYTWARYQATTAAPAAAIRVTVETPETARLVPRVFEFVPFALSPDGATLAYVAQEPKDLFLRRLDSFDVSKVPGGDGAFDPFFSPDGQWVGFWAADGRIKKVAVAGGPPAVICDAPDMLGASWGEDDSIVYAPGFAGLHRVPAAGGTPVAITTLDAARGDVQHTFPQVVGRGGLILFTAVSRSADAPFSVEVYDLATRARRTLVPDARYGRWLPTGHLAYLRDRTLFVVKADATTLQPAGDAVPILRNVETGNNGEALLSVAATGALAYFEHAPAAKTLVVVDRTGVATDLGLPPRPYQGVRLSPDGRRLAIAINEGARTDIWLSAMPPVTLERLTFGRHNRFAFQAMCFSPDGSRLLYSEDADKGSRVVSKTLDGNRATETLLTSDRRIGPKGVTRSETVLVDEFGAATGDDILLLKRGGTQEPLVADPRNQMGAALSPDEQFVAYVSEETGPHQVFLASLADRSLRRQLTTDGGREVRWSRDGREIYYRNGTRMMAIPIATAPRLSIGPPRLLFEGTFEPGFPDDPRYDVTPDGRFVMMKAETAAATRQLRLITNWLAEVTRLVN